MAEGSWPSTSRDYLLSHISKDRGSKEVINKCIQDGYIMKAYKEKPSEELTRFILTVVAIELLKTNFIEKKSQWKMIAQNAQSFCRAFKYTPGKDFRALTKLEHFIQRLTRQPIVLCEKDEVCKRFMGPHTTKSIRSIFQSESKAVTFFGEDEGHNMSLKYFDSRLSNIDFSEKTMHNKGGCCNGQDLNQCAIF